MVKRTQEVFPPDCVPIPWRWNEGVGVPTPFLGPLTMGAAEGQQLTFQPHA